VLSEYMRIRPVLQPVHLVMIEMSVAARGLTGS